MFFWKHTVKYGILEFPDFCDLFRILYGIPEAWEVFYSLPEARGFILPKYEPIPSHGVPIHAQNYINLTHTLCAPHKNIVRNPHNSTFTKSPASGMHLSFRLSIKLVGLPEFQLKSLVKVQFPSFPVSDILDDEFLSKNMNFGEFLSKKLTFRRFFFMVSPIFMNI